MPMPGGRSYLPVDDILPPPAEDMIDDIREESDDDGETRRANQRCFPIVLATVPDRHFESGSGSEPNRCQIGGPRC